MKTRNIRRTVLTALFVASMAVCNAQIFIKGGDEEELSTRLGDSGDANGEWIVGPTQGSTTDQYDYAPVGGGVLLLAGLVGAYAVAKRRKK